MLAELNWQTLAERRRLARLTMFYKIHYNLHGGHHHAFIIKVILLLYTYRKYISIQHSIIQM